MSFLVPVTFTRLNKAFFVFIPFAIVLYFWLPAFRWGSFFIFLNHDHPSVRGSLRFALRYERLGNLSKEFSKFLLPHIGEPFFSAPEGKLNFNNMSFSKELVSFLCFKSQVVDA